MKLKKRHKKASKQFRKAFKSLEKVKALQDHHRERIPRIRVPISSLLDQIGVITQAVQPGGTGGGVSGEGEGGVPTPGGNAAPMSPGPGGMGGGSPTVSPDGAIGYMSADPGFPSSTSPDGAMGFTLSIGSADIANLRKSYNSLRKMFKHVSNFDFHPVVRQQRFELQNRTFQFYDDVVKELFGGESTAPEPRI